MPHDLSFAILVLVQSYLRKNISDIVICLNAICLYAILEIILNFHRVRFVSLYPVQIRHESYFALFDI